VGELDVSYHVFRLFPLIYGWCVKDLLAGKVFVVDIMQEFLLAAIASMKIPTLMIFLSIALPAKVNRWANIIVATVSVP